MINSGQTEAAALHPQCIIHTQNLLAQVMGIVNCSLLKNEIRATFSWLKLKKSVPHPGLLLFLLTGGQPFPVLEQQPALHPVLHGAGLQGTAEPIFDPFPWTPLLDICLSLLLYMKWSLKKLNNAQVRERPRKGAFPWQLAHRLLLDPWALLVLSYWS